MEADDSYSLLAMLSGISDSEMVKEVTLKLDYQPLALASAATYVKQVRQNKETSKTFKLQVGRLLKEDTKRTAEQH